MKPSWVMCWRNRLWRFCWVSWVTFMVLAMWVGVLVAGWFVGGIFVPVCLVYLLFAPPLGFLLPIYDYNL